MLMIILNINLALALDVHAYFHQAHYKKNRIKRE